MDARLGHLQLGRGHDAELGGSAGVIDIVIASFHALARDHELACGRGQDPPVMTRHVDLLPASRGGFLVAVDITGGARRRGGVSHAAEGGVVQRGG